jgi:hypothetical protein
MMPQMNDTIFIDDSGSKLWDVPYAREFVDRPPVRNDNNRSYWMKNYFVLAGVYVDSDTISSLNPLINNKKHEVFGTKHVEIHSSDLRNPYQRRKKYLDRFDIAEATLSEFIDGFWYPMVVENPQIKIQCVVLDKRYYSHRLGRSPLAITAQALFDRIELGPNRASLILFDQMEESLRSEVREQGEILKVASHEIDLGAFFEKYSHASIGFEKSKNSNFFQIADTVAYNILRQFVDYGDQWDGSPEIEDRYPYFERIYANFYCRKGRSNPKGVGISKLPDENSLRRHSRQVDTKNHP